MYFIFSNVFIFEKFNFHNNISVSLVILKIKKFLIQKIKSLLHVNIF
jgi:hypothetical protein